MRTCSVRFIVTAIGAVFFVLVGRVFAGESSHFAENLPEFSLQDPLGNTFTNGSISEDGVVLVVTAPILSDEEVQQGWDKYLSMCRGKTRVRYVYIEDLEVSMFKNEAIDGMKRNYVSGVDPILLIDTHGSLRRALGVPAKSTVVLVYDRDGKLVHSETGRPSAEAATTIWEKCKI